MGSSFRRSSPLTGGYDSILYWLFLALIVRGAVSVPRATSQILLNLTLTACYVMAGVINIYVVRTLADEARFNATNQAAPHHARVAVEPARHPALPAGPSEAGPEPTPRGASLPAENLDEPSRETLGAYGPPDNLPRP